MIHSGLHLDPDPKEPGDFLIRVDHTSEIIGFLIRNHGNGHWMVLPDPYPHEDSRVAGHAFFKRVFPDRTPLNTNQIAVFEAALTDEENIFLKLLAA